jgi:Ca-activated chloride channel family protein
MKTVALSVVLACATMACTSSQTATAPTTPASATTTTAAGAPADATMATSADAGHVNATINRQWLGAAGESEYVLTGSREQFVGVWVDVPQGQARPHVQTALTLTIDTSGSMAGEKIRHARLAAQTMVDNMKDGDIIAVHSFNGVATELVAPVALDHHSRRAVIREIRRLEATGATNVHEAIHRAVNATRRAPSSHPVRRVVIISDGRATAGPTSVVSLGRLAELGSRFGVQVTALGVGLDYDENTLNALAMKSSGRLYHLDDSRELEGIVKSELRLLQSTMATNAFVELIPAPGVQLIGAAGAHSEWTNDGSLRLPLGTMFAGQRREVLVRYRLSTHEVEGKRPILSARLHFEDPTDGGVTRIQESIVRGELTNSPELISEHRNPDVDGIMVMRESVAVATAARGQVVSGDFDFAEEQLAMVEKKLRRNAAHANSKRDKQRIMAQANRMRHARRGVGSVKAAPKPMRARKARASSLHLNDAAMEAQGL